MRALLLALLSLVFSAGTPVAAETQLRVSTSILPVQSLVAGVMANLGEPDLILPPGASPHGYALRPSDALSLSRADVIFRVGPGLEVFLDRPLSSLSGKAVVVDLIAIPGLQLLPVRENEAFERHDHDHGHGEHGHDDHDHEKAKAKHDDHDHDHDHEKARPDDDDHDHDKAKHDDHGHEERLAGMDPHIWLDTQNAVLIVRHAAKVLGEADPENAVAFSANADAMVKRLNALEARLRDRLAPVADRPFIVFHDAYQYFERRFGLKAVGSITINPEVSPGARQISRIRSRIADQHVHCVLAEPQFNSDIVKALAGDGGIHVGVIDPVGTTEGAGSKGYMTMMDRLASGLGACLSVEG